MIPTTSLLPVLLLLLTPTTLAYTCNASYLAQQASSPPSGSSSSGSSSSSSSSSGCTTSQYGIDPNCPFRSSPCNVEACAQWLVTQTQNQVSESIANSGVFKNKMKNKRMNMNANTKRANDASVPCPPTSLCTSVGLSPTSPDAVFMCVDPTTFDFTDSNGGRGNARALTYTMSDGTVTSVASGATALPTPTGAGSGVQDQQGGCGRVGVGAMAIRSACVFFMVVLVVF